jgi:hypothetical protein
MSTHEDAPFLHSPGSSNAANTTPQQQTATPISDTPRTDAVATRLLSMMDMPRSQVGELLIHSSQLERDLAAAQAELAQALKMADDPTAIDQRDRAEEAADNLAATILGEDIDWSDHGMKWAEALDEAESIDELRTNLAASEKLCDELADMLHHCRGMFLMCRDHFAECDEESEGMPTWAKMCLDEILKIDYALKQHKDRHASARRAQR